MTEQLEVKSLELQLKDHFAPFEAQAKEWMEKAHRINVTNATQTELMAGAREARLALRGIRIAVGKKHEELKSEALRYSQMLDKIKRTMNGYIEPIEEHLQAQEDFRKVEEEKAKQKLFDERFKLLEPFLGEEAMKMALADLSEDVFQITLKGCKAQKEQREADEKAILAEQEKNRKAAEAEQKKIRDERDQLMKENEKVQAKLQKEKDERKRLEDEADVAKEKIEQEKRDRINADRRSKRAPDRDKLEAFKNKLEELTFPDVKSDEANLVAKNTMGLIMKVVLYLALEIKKL